MSCFYRFQKHKYVKKLLNLLEKPSEYLDIYNEFLELYRRRKERKEKYKDVNIEELFNSYLVSKGLKKIDEVITEIELRDRILKDKNNLLTFQKRLDKIEGLVENLQEQVIVVLKENQSFKDRMRNTNMLSNKTIKSRSKISSS